jgi:hypothetical protein
MFYQSEENACMSIQSITQKKNKFAIDKNLL